MMNLGIITAAGKGINEGCPLKNTYRMGQNWFAA